MVKEDDIFPRKGLYEKKSCNLGVLTTRSSLKFLADRVRKRNIYLFIPVHYKQYNNNQPLSQTRSCVKRLISWTDRNG